MSDGCPGGHNCVQLGRPEVRRQADRGHEALDGRRLSDDGQAVAITDQLDLIASLIEEADFTAALTESMHQVARRVKREKFGSQAQPIVDTALNKLDASLRAILPTYGLADPQMPAGHANYPEVEELRARTLSLGPNAGAAERGTILALLGSIERAEILIRRIDAERKSVNRQSVLSRAVSRKENREQRMDEGGLSPVPAE